MIREVVGAITACFVGIILLWFIIPMLNLTYETTLSVLPANATSTPTMQTLIALGDGLFLIIGFITFIVVGYLIFAYATRIVPFDYGG
jgi:hypothetical protein